MAAEQQSFRDLSQVESSKFTTSGAQYEAFDLLLTTGRLEPRGLQQLPNKLIMEENIYDRGLFSVGGAAKTPKLNDSAVDSCTIAKPNCESEKNWKPDLNRKTPGARAWDKQAESQRQKPLDLNADGSYTVKPGDSLDDISRRMLRGEGKTPTNKDVAEATRRIFETNPQLGCNPDLIRPGMKLKLPPAEAERAQPGERPGGTTGDDTRGSGNERDADRSRQRRSESPNCSQSTEQQLEEMRRCLKSVKRMLEEMRRKMDLPKANHVTPEGAGQPN